MRRLTRRGKFRYGSGGLLAVAAIMLLAATTAAAAPPGLAGDGQFYSAATPQQLSYGSAQSYWTPERVADAPPIGLPEGDASAAGAEEPELFASGVEPFKSVTIRKAAQYPNRVHGKLVGNFGSSTFSCSATVVSSGSGSLLTTAGHCVYDVNSRTVASNLAFIPGYSAGAFPYSVWPVTNLIVNRLWVRRGSLDYDFAMLRTGVSPYGSLQRIVGSRGIGFNDKRRQRLEAYGYPSRGNPKYNGDRLIRCDGGYVGDPQRYGGPRGRGMKCDQQQGSSGGGWVAGHSYVVSNTSHGYPQFSDNLFFGPYYGAAAKAMYRARNAFWPSAGPITCRGQVATIIGTDTKDRLVGGSGKDVIAGLAGNDRINGKGGNDTICGGPGNDRINGGGGKNRIDGGAGKDRCGKPKGGSRLKNCEGGKRMGGGKG